MEVVYNTNIADIIRDKVRDAEVAGKSIDYIALTQTEWDDLIKESYYFRNQPKKVGFVMEEPGQFARAYTQGIFGVKIRRWHS